jgi:hypothetical protein
MAVRGLGAEHGVHVRLALQLHRLTSAAICCVGQSTNDAAKPYQKWSFTIDRAPVKVSRLQIRGQRTLSPASRAGHSNLFSGTLIWIGEVTDAIRQVPVGCRC